MNSNSDAADGRHTTPGGITGENLLIPESGSGPGLLLLADGQVPETAGRRGRGSSRKKAMSPPCCAGRLLRRMSGRLPSG